MPLIYSFVARGTTVLADYTSYTGNFSVVAIQVRGSHPRGRRGGDRRARTRTRSDQPLIRPRHGLRTACRPWKRAAREPTPSSPTRATDTVSARPRRGRGGPAACWGARALTCAACDAHPPPCCAFSRRAAFNYLTSNGYSEPASVHAVLSCRRRCRRHRPLCRPKPCRLRSQPSWRWRTRPLAGKYPLPSWRKSARNGLTSGRPRKAPAL